MRTMRLTALAVASALSLSVLGPVSSAQAMAAKPTPAELGADWMLGNLKNGLLETTSSFGTFKAYGPSIDLAHNLRLIGGRGSGEVIANATASDITNYIGTGTEIYSGPAAKALSLESVMGRDVHAVGSVDLQVKVESTVSANGRLEDQSSYGDYANSLGQAFAARALTAEGSAKADEVTDFLLDQQCAPGFFRLSFADKTAADQTCDGAAPAVDPKTALDSTSIVVAQLAPLATNNATVQAAVSKASAWLTTQQRADGAFVDADTGANANTTGLAGIALGLSGRGTAAGKAAAWLRAQQVVGACEPTLARETGAIAYDSDSYTRGVTYGINDPLDRSQWVIAGAQALGALKWAPFATVKHSRVTAPEFARAGSNVTVVVQGVAPGERACLTGAAGNSDLIGTDAAITATITRAVAGEQSVSLVTATDTTTGTVTVLPKKTLKVKAPKKVKRGSRAKVVVKGLAAGEKVTVRFGSKKVASGKANAYGTFTSKIKVKRSIKAKHGTVKIKVRGQYKNRKATKKLRIR